jgi:predicted aspartyl protease
MTTRITVKDLDRAVIELNMALGMQMGQEGSYCLQGAYGGWQLQRRVNPVGGISAITNGYISKRELYQRITDMRRGVQIAKSKFGHFWETPTN